MKIYLFVLQPKICGGWGADIAVIRARNEPQAIEKLRRARPERFKDYRGRPIDIKPSEIREGDIVNVYCE